MKPDRQCRLEKQLDVDQKVTTKRVVSKADKVGSDERERKMMDCRETRDRKKVQKRYSREDNRDGFYHRS